MKIVYAPNKLPKLDKISLFLAGSIDQGKAV